MKLILMADSNVGLAITQWLVSRFREDLEIVIATSENDVYKIAQQAGIPCAVFISTEQVCDTIDKLGIEVDMGVLAWWPKIIKQPLLGTPRMGFLNTHPSLLPYNRGKHYNFWALVEQSPFGVSLNMIDENIDSGDLVAQASIPYGWEDNGETLYVKARNAMTQLFQDTYPALRNLNFHCQKQDLTLGSFHQAAELDVASRIDLDGNYQARNLLNLLRARTFTSYPSCYFSDGDDMFEVRIDIKRKL